MQTSSGAGHIEPNGLSDLALDAPDAPDLIWANNLIWGGHIEPGINDADPAVTANNLIWGGHIEPSGIDDPSNPGATNLIWGGHIEPANLIWGGHIEPNGYGDDPTNPFPGQP